MSKKHAFVTPVTGFQVEPDGYIYRDYNSAAEAAAEREIYLAYHDGDGDRIVRTDEASDHVYDFVAAHAGQIAEVLLANRPLIRKLMGL